MNEWLGWMHNKDQATATRSVFTQIISVAPYSKSYYASGYFEHVRIVHLYDHFLVSHSFHIHTTGYNP